MEEDDLNEKPSILFTPLEIQQLLTVNLKSLELLPPQKISGLFFRSLWGMVKIKSIVSYSIILKDFKNNMRKKSFETIYGNINIFLFYKLKQKNLQS